MKKITLVLLSGLMVSVAACNETEQVKEAANEVKEVAGVVADGATDKAKDAVKEATEVVGSAADKLKGAASSTGASLDLSTDKAKFSYAMGYQFARTLKDNDLLKEVDVDTAIVAIQETLSDAEGSMTEEQVVEAMTAFQTRVQQEAVAKAEESAKESAAFLETNKAKEGVITTDSGLQYKVITEGEGASPSDESEVEVHYKGTLIGGDTFDSSYDRGQPATFPIGNVIPGFREGMMLMKEGGKSILYIPAALAYGKQAPPSIGPDQTLIFEVELLKVN